MIKKFKNFTPIINEKSFIAESCDIIGNAKIDEETSLWFNVTVRADMDSITIGKRTNIQDNSALHTEIGHPLTIGDNVTIGHNAVIHCKSVGNNSLIGMGSILLDNAEIGNNCLIGAGSLVTEGCKIPDGQLWFGNPAKYRRDLTLEEINNIKENAQHYIDLMNEYKED